ncbi:aldo/keto reductase [Tessaracoccus sp. G1721]
MEYAHLGRSGLLVSRIGLGTMNFGDATDQAAAFGIMDRAVELGVNLFDSADVYGGPQPPDMAQGYGTSEEIIGTWLTKSGRRDRSSWPPGPTSRWGSGRTTAGCRPTT